MRNLRGTRIAYFPVLVSNHLSARTTKNQSINPIKTRVRRIPAYVRRIISVSLCCAPFSRFPSNLFSYQRICSIRRRYEAIVVDTPDLWSEHCTEDSVKASNFYYRKVYSFEKNREESLKIYARSLVRTLRQKFSQTKH